MSPVDTGGRRLVSAAGDQRPCDTCVAFAVTSSAESAVTSALALGSVTQVSLSVQSFYYCGQDAFRECDSGWSLHGALEELKKRATQLLTAACLEYSPDPSSSKSQKELCNGICSIVSPQLSQGRFEYRPITAAWKAQRHIRLHGGVISKFRVYDDFKPFFDDYKNALKVYSPKAGAKFVVNHAVFIVGYDLEKQFFYIKNSWGGDWGENGFFRAAFGCCGILEEAFGVTFEPNQPPPAAQLPVADSPNGCYLYHAVEGDYMSGIALRTGIPLEQFMRDNTARVTDLDAPIVGKDLLLCNPKAGFKTKMVEQSPSPRNNITVPKPGKDCVTFRNKCPTDIALAIGYNEGASYTTEGWWILDAMNDSEICWPPAMKSQHEVLFYFSAPGYHPSTSVLKPDMTINDTTGKDSVALCVDTGVFTIKDAVRTACKGANYKKVKFYRTVKPSGEVFKISRCPLCLEISNECKQNVNLAATPYYDTDYYWTWGWTTVPGGNEEFVFCDYVVAGTGDPKHVAVYFELAAEFKPDNVVNWPASDYADGMFCVNDVDGFDYKNAHEMKCDGKNQVKRRFWRIEVPTAVTIRPDDCGEK